MAVDVLIVTDDRDEIRLHTGPIQEAFKTARPNIRIHQVSSRRCGDNSIPKAQKILFILCGDLENAHRRCSQWFRHLKSHRSRDQERTTFLLHIAPENEIASGNDTIGRVNEVSSNQTSFQTTASAKNNFRENTEAKGRELDRTEDTDVVAETTHTTELSVFGMSSVRSVVSGQGTPRGRSVRYETEQGGINGIQTQLSTQGVTDNGNIAANSATRNTNVDIETAGIEANVATVTDLYEVSKWIPKLFRFFFDVLSDHSLHVLVHNMSLGYDIAMDMEDELNKLFKDFGFITDAIQPNCVIIVVRSRDITTDRTRSEIQNLIASKGLTEQDVYTVGTNTYSILADDNQRRDNNGGRVTIVACSMKILVKRGIIPTSPNNFIFCLKVFGTICMVVMHIVYSITFTLFAFSTPASACIGAVWSDILRAKKMDSDGQSNNCLKVFTILSANFVVLCVSSYILWILFSLFDLGITLAVPIQILLFLFYIITYTVMHLWFFRGKMGYECGIFDLPYVWWRKQPRQQPNSTRPSTNVALHRPTGPMLVPVNTSQADAQLGNAWAQQCQQNGGPT